MAPVTGRVADREKDRLLLALRAIQRLRSPGMPIDRVVLVLQQIRRCFLREMISHSARPTIRMSPRNTRMARIKKNVAVYCIDFTMIRVIRGQKRLQIKNASEACASEAFRVLRLSDAVK